MNKSNNDLKILMERITSDYLIRFKSEMEIAQDATDYFALVTAVLIFKELIISQFKYELEKDCKSEDSPDDICQIMEAQAISMACDINRRISQKTTN